MQADLCVFFLILWLNFGSVSCFWNHGNYSWDTTDPVPWVGTHRSVFKTDGPGHMLPQSYFSLVQSNFVYLSIVKNNRINMKNGSSDPLSD